MDNSTTNCGWYPCPPKEIPVRFSNSEQCQNEVINDPWTTDKLKYTSNNKWQSISKETIEACKRHKVKGVEARLLPKDHVLHGEYGLFAVQKFSKFDIVGEYTGKVVGDDVHGHYVAALEDKEHSVSLGLDAGNCGNEMRFINSYLNVAFSANVAMRTVYINTLPHIAIICTEDIMPGDELLLDYGDAYNNAYLLPKPPAVESTKQVEDLSLSEMNITLPFCDQEESNVD